ncbi:HAD family phosphatase [Notoacmeibacter sp. MSK16QG-6]|uniref:HAD family hydrolase n=1 Tax=Notoacmeibacter sp. MSK16QG-6 TaxID=2957982 RepID=UPI00209FF482|nr:HAD-IB family phosphatase [Notoacmeibacter sp. MSK16QG-6]MCP1201082.1 HAD-IB family phosphatase [Notoacmeibacter sp. MSK16QG-6]
MSRLFAFDMDGTLLPGTSGLLELAKELGTVDRLNVLETRYVAGDLDTVDFTREISRLWGPITPTIAEAAFAKAPKIDGIEEVVAQVRSAGGISCVVTMSQDIFANEFLKWGFDHVFSTTYPPNHGYNYDKILTPEHKIHLLQDVADEHGFDFVETVAFGDSRSDVPLFQKVKYPISINGDEYVEAHAVMAYNGNSLLDAFIQSERLWSPR